jgi:hypothetical protein
VARPLHVLVPLIQDDLAHAREAGTPYYEPAGEKMLEARDLVKGQFVPWIKRNFQASRTSARQYMRLAEVMREKKGLPSFLSLNEFHRQTGDPAYVKVVRPQSWHQPRSL